MFNCWRWLMPPEKAGVDKDPQYMELMKIVQVRTLGEAYKRYLEAKFGNPSQEEIETYYKQNGAKFEAIKVERVIIPVSSRKIGRIGGRSR